MNKQQKSKSNISRGENDVNEIMKQNFINDLELAYKSYLKKNSISKIRKFKKWAYIDNICEINNLEFKGRISKYIVETTLMFNNFISKMYLQKMYTFDVDQSIFNFEPVVDIKTVMDQILKMSKEIIKITSLKRIKCRIKSEDFSFMLSFSEDNKRISFISALFDNLKKIVEFSLEDNYESNKQNNSMQIRTYDLCPFVIGKKERDVDSHLKDILKEKNPNDYRLSLIYNTLLILLGSIGYNNKMLDPEFTNNEMYFIEKIFQKRNYYIGEFYPFDLYNWVCTDQESVTSQFSYLCEYNYLLHYIKDQDSKNPLIDFNRRELNFIIKYCKESGYMVKGNIDNRFNLAQFIKESPYGDKFRFKIPGYADKEFTTSCVLNEEKDLLRIFITHPIDNFIVFAFIDFINISNFNINDSYVSLNSSVLFKNTDDFPNSKSAILDMIPDMFKNVELLMDAAQILIETFIIINDKPERSRIVRCVEYSNNQRSPKDVTDNNKIITRILKSTRDARKYVESMISCNDVNREYVIESWKRKGHYRQNKNGNKVWIPETTCNRHLPLTEKEICIKL